MADDLLNDLRAIKSQGEIALLAQAAQVGDTIMTAGMAASVEGADEGKVELAMRRAAMEASSDLVAQVGVYSGPSLKVRPWPPVTMRHIEQGDFNFD